MLFCQLDESCVAQHANERKVRTLEEEEEVVSSAVGGEASTVSDDVDDCDLEELASVENLDDNTDDDDDDYDDDDDDGVDNSGAPQSGDNNFSSGIPVVSVGNSKEITNSSMLDNDADTSGDVSTSAPSSGQADEDIGSSSLPDFSEDVPALAASSGQGDAQSSDDEIVKDTAGSVSEIDNSADVRGIASVDTETSEVDKDVPYGVEEFPDTSIELQHISGSKLVFSFLLAD